MEVDVSEEGYRAWEGAVRGDEASVTCPVPAPGLAIAAGVLTPVVLVQPGLGSPLALLPFARGRSSLTATDPDGLARATAGGDATADRNVADGDCIRPSLLPVLKLCQGGWEIIPDPPCFGSPCPARSSSATVSANHKRRLVTVLAHAKTKRLYGNHVLFTCAVTGEVGTLFAAIRAPLSSIRRYRDDDASSPLPPLLFKLSLLSLPDWRSASLRRLSLRTVASENTLIDFDLPNLVIFWSPVR